MNKPTDQLILEYILTHTNEDFPMDQTLEDFYKKVEDWDKNRNKTS